MEDSKIIGLFWERTEHAIAVTSSRYGAYLRRIAYNILTSHADAEECENDTYVAMCWWRLPPRAFHPKKYLDC